SVKPGDLFRPLDRYHRMTDRGDPISWVRSLPRTLDADFGTGVSFPVGQTRFVWTHLATAESSLASWRSASRLTSTFQSQLFHVCLASNGRYGPTTHRPPVQAMELLAFAFRSFHLCASWRTFGLKSGEYAGNGSTRAPVALVKARTPALL